MRWIVVAVVLACSMPALGRSPQVGARGKNGTNQLADVAPAAGLKAGRNPAGKLSAERRQALAHKRAGDRALRERRLAEAVAFYRQAIGADYSYTAAYNELGNALFALGRHAQAVRVFRIAIRDNPEYHLGWYNLAYALRKAGRLAEAAAAYQKFAQGAPGDADPYFGLGLTYRAQGDRRRAVEAFRQYIGLERRTAQARWVEQARQAIVAMGGTAPAVSLGPRSARPTRLPADAARSAPEARAGHSATRRALAVRRSAAALVLAARHDHAAVPRRPAPSRKTSALVRREALVVRPTSRAQRLVTRDGRGQRDSERFRTPSADRGGKSRHVYEAEPDRPVAIPVPPRPLGVGAGLVERLRVQGDSLARIGKCGEAMMLYRRARAADPFHLATYDGLAHCLQRLKGYVEGIRLVSAALRDNPRYYRGWLHLARLRDTSGDTAGAVGNYRRYVQLRPSDPDGHFELARCLRHLGQRDAAAAAYRRYLARERRVSDASRSRRVAAAHELAKVGGGVTVAESAQGPASARGGRQPVEVPLVRKLSAAELRRQARERKRADARIAAAQRRLERLEKIRQRKEARRLRLEQAKLQREARRMERLERRRLQQEARRLGLAEATRLKEERALALRAAQEARRLPEGRLGAAVRRPEGSGVAVGAIGSGSAKPGGARRPGSPGPHVAMAALGQDLDQAGLGRGAEAGPRGPALAAPEAARALVEIADRQFGKGRYLVALGIYRQAAAIGAPGTAALYKAGLAAVAAGKMRVAAGLFSRVLRVSPTDSAARASYDLARRAAAGSAKANVSTVQAALDGARQALAHKRYAAVDRLLAPALQEGVNAEAYLLRARAWLGRGRPRSALLDAARCQSLSPDSAGALVVMADAQRQLGSLGRAIHNYRLFLSADGAHATERRRVQRVLAELLKQAAPRVARGKE